MVKGGKISRVTKYEVVAFNKRVSQILKAQVLIIELDGGSSMNKRT